MIAARARRLRYSLAPMLVSEMMSRTLVTASPGDTVAIARDRLRVNQIHHLLVMSGEQVVGVLAFRDLAGKPDDVRVEELMSREIATIDAASTLRRAASLMIRSTTGCLPVVENGKVAGIITTTDLMKVLNTDMTLS
jgi:acetoin utilization protein AcuB